MELRSVIKTILEIYFLLQITTFSQTSRVTNAKYQIRNLIGDELAEARNEVRRVRHTSGVDNPRRWSSRRKLGASFSLWSAWSKCDMSCIRRRERFCKVKRACGFTKQIEEQMCKNCIFHPNLIVNAPINNLQQYLPRFKNGNNNNNNNYYYEKNPVPIPIPVYQELEEPNKSYEDTSDFVVIKKRNKKYRKKKKPIVVEIEDYEDIEDDDDDYFSDTFGLRLNKKQIKAIRTKNLLSEIGYGNRHQKHRIRFKPKKKKNLYQNIDEFDYNDDTIDFLEKRNDYVEIPNEFDERYESNQYRNMTRSSLPKEKAVIELPRYRRVYSKWSKWTKCSSKCTTRRYKKCRMKEICGKEVLREIAYCYTEGSFCQQWLQTQIQKNTQYDAKPIISDRKDVINTNAVVNNYIISDKGYRGSEYAPMKLKCGIPNIRKSLSNMLKIIGGKVSRKGEWPWQAVIFNRYKEAFCGGTLIAPQWVLTAAHCVRKVLYVRLGEHNLDIDDGTEAEFRVTRSFKHPSYDKATVDSDIALLKLPKPVNVSTWIGFSCLPQPFQPLPRNVLCTVIGWGKRRNRDQSGTSVLHQAEVPIISMDHCKTVYFDYTITKNMFCAGHKRGRIDTCAGDSGGPLLCRDTTKPNNPWTIFGITSFGDGCAKKNKFGIYAKVPNYVDWIWSVVNCNGNCKSRKRT